MHYEEVTYEGYGPGGVAVMVECLTDNRNRTAGDVRAIVRQARRQPGRRAAWSGTSKTRG